MKFFQGESKQITLYYKDSNMNPIDMTGYVFSLIGKESELQTEPMFEMRNDVFDKTDAATGKIILTFLADMSVQGYLCQVTAIKGTTIDKSPIFQVEVMKSL
jgi:hypothetical protein